MPTQRTKTSMHVFFAAIGMFGICCISANIGRCLAYFHQPLKQKRFIFNSNDFSHNVDKFKM